MTLLGVRLSVDAVPPLVIGGIMVSYSVGFVFGSLFAINIIHRAGHVRAFAVFCAVLGIATLCYPLTDNIVLWMALRVVGGFAMAGTLIVAESWFSTIATNDNRSKIFSLYQICFYLATSIGQLLVMLGNPSSHFLFTLATILLLAAILPLGITRMQTPVLDSIERLSIRKVLAISPLGVIATFTAGIIISSFYGVGPLFANMIGFSVEQTAWFMSLSIFTIMLLAWPIGWLCDKIDRVTVLFYLTVAGAILSVSVYLSSQIPWLVILANGLFMAMVAAIYPLGVALMNDRISSDKMISASATLLLSFGVGSCIGPFTSAYLIEIIGASGMYLSNAILLIGLASYTRYRLGRGLTVDVEHQEPFYAVIPEVTPIINELNPLNEDFQESPESSQPTDSAAQKTR